MISTSQLAEALEEGERVGARLGQVLSHGGVIREDDLLRVLSEHFGLPLIDLAEHEPDREALALSPRPSSASSAACRSPPTAEPFTSRSPTSSTRKP